MGISGYGEPDDVPDQCNARLQISDNFGDGHATMRCTREPGHKGRHHEEFEHVNGKAIVKWDGDYRKRS